MTPGPRIQALWQAEEALFELLFGRIVDNFETYIASMIREVLRKQPSILSTSTYNLDMKSILDHTTIDSLAQNLAERKVSSLWYTGFSDLADWCSKQGIPLVVSAGQLPAVVELVATRNVIAHNRAVIDQKYLGIVKQSRFKIGEIRRLTIDDIAGTVSLLDDVVGVTDPAISSAFGIETLERRNLQVCEFQEHARGKQAGRSTAKETLDHSPADCRRVLLRVVGRVRREAE